MQTCIPVWDCTKLTEAQTDAYLREVRRLWPQHLYYYREEIALMYLAFKSYQVDRALISIYINVQELIQLIQIEHSRVKTAYQKRGVEPTKMSTREQALPECGFSTISADAIN